MARATSQPSATSVAYQWELSDPSGISVMSSSGSAPYRAPFRVFTSIQATDLEGTNRTGSSQLCTSKELPQAEKGAPSEICTPRIKPGSMPHITTSALGTMLAGSTNLAVRISHESLQDPSGLPSANRLISSNSWPQDSISHTATGCCTLHSIALLPCALAPPARQKFTPRNVEFQAKILARSGLGDDTYLPPGLAENPPAISMSDARWEFEQVGGR